MSRSSAPAADEERYGLGRRALLVLVGVLMAAAGLALAWVFG